MKRLFGLLGSFIAMTSVILISVSTFADPQSDEARAKAQELEWKKNFKVKVGEKVNVGKENLELFQKDEKVLNNFLGYFLSSFVSSYTASPKFNAHFDKKYGMGTSKKIDIPALKAEVIKDVTSRPHKDKLRIGNSETIWVELMKLTVDLATKQLAIKAGVWKEPAKAKKETQEKASPAPAAGGKH